MTALVRVLFMGTPDFAVPSLVKLLNSSFIDVVGVITQPDRPAGRGFRMIPPAVKRVAEERGLPVLQPVRLRGNEDAVSHCRSLMPDLGVVAAFGQILPRDVFELPLFGTLNVHASLLPRYRGAAPVEHAILDGESVTGVTIMRIEEGLDTGDIVNMRSIPIPENMTGGELTAELAEFGANLLLETIPEYVRGRIRPRPQEHDRATYAPRIEKDQARIDWSHPARDLHNCIRAFNPRPGAFAHFRGEYTKIWSSHLPAGQEGISGDLVPGLIVGTSTERIDVVCGEGSLLHLRELQLAGRRRLAAGDFVNGLGVRVGEVFC